MGTEDSSVERSRAIGHVGTVSTTVKVAGLSDLVNGRGQSANEEEHKDAHGGLAQGAWPLIVPA